LIVRFAATPPHTNLNEELGSYLKENQLQYEIDVSKYWPRRCLVINDTESHFEVYKAVYGTPDDPKIVATSGTVQSIAPKSVEGVQDDIMTVCFSVAEIPQKTQVDTSFKFSISTYLVRSWSEKDADYEDSES